MNKKNKLLEKALNHPSSLSFSDFETVLRQLGWVFKRQSGSHAIWHSPNGYRLVIQNNKGKAKEYQVKQFISQLSDEEIENEN